MEPLGDDPRNDGAPGRLRLRIVTAPPGVVPPKLELSLVVREDRPLTVGRLDDNDLVLPDDNLHVSRCHCRFDQQDDGVWLLQNRSAKNGTWVNDKLLAENEVVAIGAGDSVRIVDYILHVEEIEPAEETATQHEGANSPPSEPPCPPAPELPPVVGNGEDDLWPPETPVRPEGATVIVSPRPRTAGRDKQTGDHPPGDGQRPAESAPGSDENAIAAFLAGAGMPRLPEGADPAKAMRAVGEASRVLLRTLAQLFAARCRLESDFRITRRHITPTRSNPFKSLVDEGHMLAVLLGETPPGFASAPAAVAEACRDLVEHQITLLAEFQGQLDQVMQRLSPKEIAGATKTGLLGGKAKLWEHYEAVYGDVQRNLESNLAGPLRQALARAHEAHAKRGD